MELLESERRILSPGCCTGEREKERERERGEGRGRELRTMHHAILLFYLKREWKIIRQDRDPRDCEYYTEIKHVTSRRIERQEDDETLQDRQEDELGGNREVRGGREMGERNTAPESANKRHRLWTSLEGNAGERGETVQHFPASPADKQLDKLGWFCCCVYSSVSSVDLCVVSRWCSVQEAPSEVCLLL